MIRSELKKRNIAVVVYLVGIAASVVRSKVYGITEDDLLGNFLLFGTVGALIAACWFYLKAKRRTGAWLLLIPLNAIALIIYWMLQDCSELPQEPRCSKCGAANLPTDASCRLCHTALQTDVQSVA